MLKDRKKQSEAIKQSLKVDSDMRERGWDYQTGM